MLRNIVPASLEYLIFVSSIGVNDKYIHSEHSNGTEVEFRPLKLLRLIIQSHEYPEAKRSPLASVIVSVLNRYRTKVQEELFEIAFHLYNGRLRITFINHTIFVLELKAQYFSSFFYFSLTGIKARIKK